MKNTRKKTKKKLGSLALVVYYKLLILVETKEMGTPWCGSACMCVVFLFIPGKCKSIPGTVRPSIAFFQKVLRYH